MSPSREERLANLRANLFLYWQEFGYLGEKRATLLEWMGSDKQYLRNFLLASLRRHRIIIKKQGRYFFSRVRSS